MSLFIFKNRTLYADTRKIVNFPDGAMMGGVMETKVTDYGWGKLAIAGYESTRKDDLNLQRLMTWYSGFALINDCIKLAGEGDKNNQKLQSLALKIVKALGDAADTYIASRQIESFIGITKYSTLSSQNSQALRVERVSDCLEAVGSCHGVARQLVLHNTPPKEVYKVLRLADAPVGGPIEEHSVDDLSDLYPPINGYSFWVFLARFIISEKSEGLTEKQLCDIAAIAYNSEKFFKQKKNSEIVVPNLETFRNLNSLLEVPEDEESLDTYKSILKIIKG